jgi:hypothetical protein
MSTEHPSFLALDRLALGEDAPAATRAHVERCEACRAHLDSVRIPSEPVPTWARQLASAPRGGDRRPHWLAMLWHSAQPGHRIRARTHVAWLGACGTGLVAAMAAVLLFIVVPRLSPEEGGSGVRAKGMPGVVVYLRQEGRVVQWNARTPVRAGDEVRLKLVADGFTHVAVTSLPRQAGAAPFVLHRGTLAGPEVLLPEGWRFDASPGPEQVGVAFSLRPLTDAELAAALRERPRTAELWTSILVFQKDETSEGVHP